MQNGWTALIVASEDGHNDIIKLLLSNANTNINKQDNVSMYII